MFIIRCSSCGFEIQDEKQIRLYGGVELAMKILGLPGSAVEKRRKTADLFNRSGVPCPKCRKTDIWTWL
ncbi:hypothetical protein [Persephonella sp.]|nr:hypothetical protein [Aquificota bacterium]